MRTSHEIETIENIAYVINEVINRNTSGNAGREIIAFILDERNVEEFFSCFAEDKKYSKKNFRIHLEIIMGLLSFCLQEETRNNYKSQFVNNTENGDTLCEKLASSFMDKVNEKIPELFSFLKRSSNSHPINTSWKEKITIFGLDKMKILEIISFLLKFNKQKFLDTLLAQEIFPKLFVKKLTIAFLIEFIGGFSGTSISFYVS